MALKKCSSCGLAWSVTDFRKRADSEGRLGVCRKCEAKANKTRRAKYRKRVLEDRLVTSGTTSADPAIVRLVELAKKPIAFDELCDKLDMPPAKARVLVQKALDSHAPIHVEHDIISLGARGSAIETVQDVAASAPAGPIVRVGAISDTHLGSKYCLRGAIRETVKWMYKQGVRDILHSGDVLEGCYRHAQYELSHVGFDEQIRDASKCFPKLDALNYHFISGNHDFTFEDKIGMRAAVAIEQGMKSHSRSDWHAYGDRNAYLQLNGATINLYHPNGSPAYAKSYKVQKRIESYTAIKPQILLMGHYHQFGYVYERGVHGIMMPSFQGSGSNFAQSLMGAPSIGGLILEWQLDTNGRLRHFGLKPRFFYETEAIFTARNDLDAEAIQPVGRDVRYRKKERV